MGSENQLILFTSKERELGWIRIQIQCNFLSSGGEKKFLKYRQSLHHGHWCTHSPSTYYINILFFWGVKDLVNIMKWLIFYWFYWEVKLGYVNIFCFLFFSFSFFFFSFISWRLITSQFSVGFVIHWHESAMELHVFPIPIPSCWF